MSNPPIRIILVDDHNLARQSWRMLLDFDPRFSVIQECDNGNDAIEHANRIPHDVILVDINMYPVNGFEVTQRVLKTNPDSKIIGISVNNQPSYADRMLELGARGFVTKGSSFEEITHAIVKVHSGERYVCDEVRSLSE
jgi:two-component system invasion response regulator UvrY